MSPRWHRAAMACAGVGLLFLTGCGHQEKLDHQERSAQSGREIEEHLPGLLRAAGWNSVGWLRETSCVGAKSDPDAYAEETNWTAGNTAKERDPAVAEQVAQRVRGQAESTGWDTQPGPGHTGDMLYRATLGDLFLNVQHTVENTSEPFLTVEVFTSCVEMPDDHTMTRSELDPDYGSPDEKYPDDDRSKFSHGEPKPLPSGS